MFYARAFFLIKLYSDRFHQPAAFGKSVARGVKVQMHGIKAKRTVIAAASAFVLSDFLSAFLADKAFVYCGGILSLIHSNYS